MKRTIALLLSLLLALSLCACGGETAAAPDAGDNGAAEDIGKALALGQTGGTDIVSVTLDWAELAIALENTWGDDYYTAKTYHAQEDAKNPFVAAKGHTLVAFMYTISNLDRASVDLDGSFNPKLITVGYQGKSYENETHYGAAGTKDEFGVMQWESYSSTNILLSAGETETYKGYMDIDTEAADLSDAFTLSFDLPTAQGGTETVEFSINSAGQAAAKQALEQSAADAQAAADAALAEALSEVDAAVADGVTAALQGEWEYSKDNVYYELAFNGNAVTVTSSVSGASLSNAGTFSVRRDYILLEYDNGARAGIPYTFENGELTMSYIEGLD